MTYLHKNQRNIKALQWKFPNYGWVWELLVGSLLLKTDDGRLGHSFLAGLAGVAPDSRQRLMDYRDNLVGAAVGQSELQALSVTEVLAPSAQNA